MKIEDLRRGNLILTSKDKGGKIFLRAIVEEIKKDSVVVMGDRVVRIEDCEGIPLDEDWLLKFGFEKSIPMFSFYDKGHIRIDVKDGFGFHGVPIKTVHHLQNLYHSLMCEELKVQTPQQI